MFNILDLDTRELIKKNGELLKFNTGEEAKQYITSAKLIQRSLRLQPRRVVEELNSNWQEREAAKFISGEYVIPQCLRDIGLPGHFLHLAQGNDGMLAYTKDEEKGASDIQTRVSLTGYVEKYHPKMSMESLNQLIKAFHTEVKIDDGVRFAMTSEEIIKVYRDSASSCASCMSPDFGGFPMHPVGVYGAGDIGVAYKLDSKGVIRARCVCWPKKKVYARMYGYGPEGQSLHDKLKARGFKPTENGREFIGAKLLVVPYKKGEAIYVCPSIDFSCRFTLSRDKKYFVIDGKGAGASGGGCGYVRYGWVCARSKRSYAPHNKMYNVVVDTHCRTEIWGWWAMARYAYRGRTAAQKGRFYASPEIRDFYKPE